MKWFWICLFAFLSMLVLMVGMFRPDLLDATLGFTGLFLSALAYVTVAGAGLAVLIGGALLAWWWWHRSQVESLRPRDGHYPIQRVKVAGGRVVFVDPNQTVGPAIMVDRKTGEIFEHTPAAGWNIQATIRGMVERTRTAQAMFQGDASRSTLHGSQSRGDRVTAPAARLAAGAYDRPVKLAPQAEAAPARIEAAPARQWAPRDAFQNNTNTKLVMGQTTAGELVYWDMKNVPHLRFHGQTQGSGKTNALQTLAAGAARTGAHVIVLDRRSFKDWADFRGIAELVDSRDPRTFAAAVLALQKVYQERDRKLGAAGAHNISELPNAPQRIVAVVSEFGALCNAAASEGVLDQIYKPLDSIMREAGASGVHMLIEDQVVDKRWPRGIAGNAEPIIGRMPAYAGQACGYIGRGGKTTADLEPYTFHYAGAVFKTWHMAPALRGLLAAAPDAGEPLVSTVTVSSQPVHNPVHEAVHSPVHGQFIGSSPEVAPPPAPAMNWTMNTPPADPDWYEWTLDNYFPMHPELLQTDAQGRGMGIQALAEAMGAVNGKTAKDMKGTASGVAKRLRTEAALPGGDRLGVDITHGGA